MSQESVRIIRSGALVVLQDDRNLKALVMHFQLAREVAALLEQSPPADWRNGDCWIVGDLHHWHLMSTAKGYAISFPVEVAAAVAAGLRKQAALADEEAHAEQLIHDGGLLAWMGLPVGLSDHPDIRTATKNEAEKYCGSTRRPPGAIEPTSIVGTPAFTNHPARMPA